MLKYRDPQYQAKNKMMDFIQEPHLFHMAQEAYNSLRDEGNQAIIISGESGAGKTEATKFILRYLAEVSKQAVDLNQKPKAQKKQDFSIEKQVLDSNPVLESFGNAKTLRNDNSSRFGKFIEVNFEMPSLRLYSARILNCLLEKSRVVNQQIGERNYHIFYQLCACEDQEIRDKYFIEPADYFNYLSQSKTLTIPNVDDGKEFSETNSCMDNLKFTQQEKDNVWSILMGILYLGNIDFQEEDSTSLSGTSYLPAKIDENTNDALNKASILLGISTDQLADMMITRTMQDPEKLVPIKIAQSLQQSYDNRDAASKSIYGKMFD